MTAPAATPGVDDLVGQPADDRGGVHTLDGVDPGNGDDVDGVDGLRVDDETDSVDPDAVTTQDCRDVRSQESGATLTQRAALGVVLAVAATFYLWALDATGTVNEYYAQAVAAGSNSWSAMFFGSLDTGNFITVDKPPLSLWVQSASVRLFGYNTWAILVPQAIAGVVTVWLTHDAVRRIWGRWAGITAAAALAVTPITVAMTRSNLPDTVMILCLVAGGWMLTRALTTSDRSLAWLLMAFAMVGLGFEAKMLQAWIVLPAFAASYLLFGPTRWAARVRHLAIAGFTCLSVSFAWAIAVELWPGATPWIGGSDDGSVFDLIFGYNGLGRVFGEDAVASGAASGGAGGGDGGAFDDGPSWLRLFNADNGHQIAWLLPAALASIALGAVVARTTKSRRTAAGVTLWGGWTVTHIVVFARAEGIYHPYYTSAMAPAIAALVGAGAVMAWRWRHKRSVIASSAVVLVGSALLAGWLFDRAGWNTWVGSVVVAGTVLGSAAMIAGSVADRRRLVAAGIAAGLLSVFTAMGVYAGAALVSENAAGGSPSAGPTGTASFNGRRTAGPGQPPLGGAPGGALPPDGQLVPDGQLAPDGQVTPNGRPLPNGQLPAGEVPTGGLPGAGGPLGSEAQDVDELTNWLLDRWDGETWIVAVSGSGTASSITLAADGAPVMTMGGFNGSDPTPTADELARYVADGKVRFVVTGGMTGPGASAATATISAERTAWVESTCTAVDGPIDGLYDCATGSRS